MIAAMVLFYYFGGISLLFNVPEHIKLKRQYKMCCGSLCSNFGKQFKWRFVAILLPILLSLSDSITGTISFISLNLNNLKMQFT